MSVNRTDGIPICFQKLSFRLNDGSAKRPSLARNGTQHSFKGAQVEDNAMIKATTILAGAALLGVTFLLAPVPAANATPTRSVERAATLQLSAQYHHYNHRHHHCWWSHGHRHCVWR